MAWRCFQKLGPVVGRAKGIRNLMRKLMLDDFGLDVQLLVQDRSRHRAKSVPGNFGLGVVPHPP
jgi:hypothetical protein